jgi:signal peptidase II
MTARWYWWLSGSVIVLDQVTKFLAETLLTFHQPVPVLPSFNLLLTYNTGAAFSFLAGASGWQRWFFLGLGSLVSIGLIVWLRRLKPTETRLATALALILGGAIGNLIDRAWLGQVIDFIQLYYQHWYWPAFNLADSAITVGAALLVLDSLWSSRTSKPNTLDGT